ncbi:MAG: methyl-accepting chemotaxis protein [Oscillatoriaceae bacterium SKW80]|nr:methyl-accepting chemotaxis protein [Oscillatoriaceae bacterium SKYG93]MCX8121422.1 methyl-accepting chemotaxis protein [Oscillatoriaceae bacterium SKW80]MDW8451901.1 methyl-accepting chemotaxis protein [Oscillatoriaceae cyanobacterium SKYGB_i_bin93]HIK29444.1 HAMP domain-containing protein [Oscillatoriaceae cyanobacterium M7585_C2015_266]
MTASQKGEHTECAPEIETLYSQVKANPKDWVAKMRLAEILEQQGRNDEAKALYQEVIAAAPNGLFTANKVAQKTSSPSPFWGRFFNLPIRRQLLLILLASKLMGVLVLGVTGVWVFTGAWQRQQLESASERLAMYLNDAGVKKSLDKIISGDKNVLEKILLLYPTGFKVYLQNSLGELKQIAPAESRKQSTEASISAAEADLLLKAVANPGSMVTGRVKLGARFYVIAAQALQEKKISQIPIVAISMPENQISQRLGEMVVTLVGVGAVLLVIELLVVGLLVGVLTEPVKRLQEATQKLINGDFSVRVPVVADGNFGLLLTSFNELAEHLGASAAAMEEKNRQYIAEINFEVREKERLLQALQLLQAVITSVKQGDLTVRMQVDVEKLSEPLRGLAVSFNDIIESLQQVITAVQIAANQICEQARHRSWEMDKLALEANNQVKAIATALEAAGDMGKSMQSIASTTLQAAVMARQGVAAAKNGCKFTQQTADSIEQIRFATVDVCEKVNRLAEGCQEISKIVSFIAVVSDKTAILSFNASIAAARFGEQGQAFRMVATEVRNLAERVKDSAREIEQVVDSIQRGVAEVREMMQGNVQQLENGTQLVATTQQTLRKLVEIIQNINQLLQSISASTVSQAQASQQINQTMQTAAASARTTATESTTAVGAFEELVEIAENLQASVSRFRVDKTITRKIL